MSPKDLINPTEPEPPLQQLQLLQPLQRQAAGAVANTDDPEEADHDSRASAALRPIGDAAAGYCADGVCYLPGS